jgi:hypothetical protein
MNIKNKKALYYKFKLRWRNDATIGNSKKGRRSGEERRKKQSKEYFFNGGNERRSWAERRNLWYLTM